MACSDPEDLESNFDNLCITTDLTCRRRSKSLSGSLSNVRSRRRRPVHYYKKDGFTSVIRPAKLHFSSFCKKSSVIRPAKLNNVRSAKLLLLKPATLVVAVENSAKSLKRTKFSKSLNVPTPSFSSRNIFSDRLRSQTSFKSLVPGENSEIPITFTKSSFKDLRQNKANEADTGSSTNKKETNTCSIEARLESNAPIVDRDDTSIDELASYFDLFVHIPKKMSTMAEMMYI